MKDGSGVYFSTRALEVADPGETVIRL